MRIEFKTNIDCCKILMHDLRYEGEIAPVIGDCVVVLDEPRKRVELAVVGRTFTRDKTSFKWFIEVELNLDPYWAELGFKDFERFVKS